MKITLQIIIYLSFSLGLSAQGESDWWYFGEYAGIHFIDDTLEVVYDSEMNSNSGNTTMSDNEGALLYYTNGGIMYNSEHEIMENGEDLGGSSTNTLAMSFKPDLEDNKYIFINGVTGGGAWGEFWYGYIDMDANGGLGSVTAHNYLSDSLLQYMASTKKANGIDYWIVFRKALGNTYVSYSLTSVGIDLLNPVYSESGDLFMENDPFFTIGSIKIDANGDLLAFTHRNHNSGTEIISHGKLELFFFDNETGMVGERVVKLDETNAPYINAAGTNPTFSGAGIEFSNDGEKLYYTNTSEVYQTNISILDSFLVVQSLVQFNNFLSPYHLYGLQLAKDGRIYVASGPGVTSIATIHNPNIAGLDAGFELIALDLAPNIGKRELPNFDPSLFSSGFNVSNRCVNTQTAFSLLYDMPYSYVFWEFGDGATSIEWEPVHTYSSIGTYTVNLTTVVGEDTTNKSMDVIIEDVPSVDLGLDSALFCGGDTLVLNAYNYASYYFWQDSSYQSTFEVTDEGKYNVQVKNICGQDSDTVIYVLDRDNVNLGTDTMICIQEPLYLLADQPSATSWLWQDGSTLPYYEAENEGDYFVFVTTPCQFIYDSISVYTEDCSLLAPNIITPNGDGVNDVFKVINIEMLDYNWSLEVYNRWGKQVYFSENYQNDWNADKLSDAVYFYILRSSLTTTSYKGSVTVIRD